MRSPVSHVCVFVCVCASVAQNKGAFQRTAICMPNRLLVQPFLHAALTSMRACVCVCVQRKVRKNGRVPPACLNPNHSVANAHDVCASTVRGSVCVRAHVWQCTLVFLCVQKSYQKSENRCGCHVLQSRVRMTVQLQHKTRVVAALGQSTPSYCMAHG